jgi:hypothetical protein
MPCALCNTIHAEGTPCAGTPAPPTFDAAAFTASIEAAIASGFSAQAAAAAAAPGPERVPILAGTGAVVNEPLPYRFDGGPSTFCFSKDLIASLKHNDAEAAQRMEGFWEQVGPMFNIATADVAQINPNVNRPDLYVDQREFDYPMFSAINSGTLQDNTPFVVPKFATSSGLVADHVAGVEPTTGAFTTGAQTITPTPLSGKAVINREVWDQGGNPMLDTILWRQIVRAYYEGLEAFIQAQLVANAASIVDITVTTAAVDAALDASLTSQLAVLQYVRGGNHFRDFFLQIDLFKALIAAKDTAGRKLYPYLSPQNATGTVAAFFGAIDIGGLAGRPAWATAATSVNPGSSWLLDRGDVHCWATAPRKITMDAIKVATVEVGVWGYKAFAITDITGIREVIYDPV